MRRLLVLGGCILVGIGVGRFVVPRLELRREVTALVRSRDNYCHFNLSTTESIVGQPLYLIDGGKILECGERWRLSDQGFIYCDCDE